MESNVDANISLSTFVKLKPWYVKPIVVRETCCCRYHVEFELYYETFLNFGMQCWPNTPPHQRKFQFKMGLPKIIQIPCHHVLANQNALKFKKGAPLKQIFNINLGIGIIQKLLFLFVTHVVVDTMQNSNCIMRHFHIVACSVGQITPLLQVFMNLYLKYYVHERMIKYSIRNNASGVKNVRNVLIWPFLMLTTTLMQTILKYQITL